MYKVVLESFGTLKGKTIEGIALTPAVSLNHNIYSSEAIDNAKNLGVSLPANWEHTEEIVGSVVYSQGPNHSILYKAEITTERANELKEGVHKVSIEANIDEVVESCNRKGCYNLVDGITFEGIGITVNPGVQTTTLTIVESFQDWDIIKKNCKKCESDCVSDCLKDKADKGIEIDDQAKAICFSECEQTKESEELSKKIEQLEQQVADLSRPKCTTCGKFKSKEADDEDDDVQWITVHGVHIPIKSGQDKQDVIDDFIKKGGSTSTGKLMGGGKKDYTQKDIDVRAKKIWNGYSDDQKRNVYATYTNIKPKDVDLGGMTYSSLPKYVKLSLKDDAEDSLKRPSKK